MANLFSMSVVTVPDFFAKVNSAQIASFLKWRVVEKCLLPFILTCIAEYLRRYFFFQIVIATTGRLIDVLGKFFFFILLISACAVLASYSIMRRFENYNHWFFSVFSK